MADKQSSYDRIPPHNLEAEESLLGATLLSRDAIAEIHEIVDIDDFYREANQKIFQAIIELYSSGEPVDAITLAESLKRKGWLDAVGGKSYIHTLVNVVPTAANAVFYANIVSQTAILRRLIRAATEIAALGYSIPEDIEETINTAEALIFDVSKKRRTGTLETIGSLLEETYERLERLSESGSHVTGIATGFTEFDKLTSGLQPSDFIVVAGRPGMGKTSFVLTIAQHVALDQRLPVAIFSLEMSKHQLVQRMLCSEARVNAKNLRDGSLKEDDWRRVSSAMNRMSEAPIWIDDSANVTMLSVRSTARRLDSKQPLGLIIVDYLQLMQSHSRTENRQQEISDISRAMKILGRELNVPVLAVSQLSRAVESRTDKRPMLADLRECVTGDTIVLLADGARKPIRDLVGTSPDVLAMNPDGKIVTAVSDKVWPVGRRKIYKVRFSSGRSIRATEKHRLFTFDGWCRVEDMAAGHRIAIARKIPEPKNPVVWTDKRIALLAHLVGDGSYLKGQPMRYTTASEENSRLVSECAIEEFGAVVSRHTGRGNWHQLVISGNGNRWHPAGVNAWLRELGVFNQRSHEKHLPEDVFKFSDRQIALILRHLWATDGTITPRPEGTKGSAGVFFTTSSKELAADVAYLLLRLGIVARTRTVSQDGSRPWFNVCVSGARSLKAFIEQVGAFGPRVKGAARLIAALKDINENPNVDTVPNEVFGVVRNIMKDNGISQREMALIRGTSYGGSSHFGYAPSRAAVLDYAVVLEDERLLRFAENDLFWDEIQSIEPVGEDEVFDLTVPGPASWLADGIVSHNSGAIEQDADLVTFIYRDEYYDKHSDEKGTAEIIIGKHRHGPTDTVRLAFIEHFTKFDNLDIRQNPDF